MSWERRYNNRPLATDFNYPLIGKLLVSFEELHFHTLLLLFIIVAYGFS
jgi:hypothetical protein